MRINSISFKGGYWESANYIGTADPKVLKTLKKARPYLKHIGYSMPDPKELVVSVGKDDNGDTFIKTYNYDAHKGKGRLIVEENSKTITPGDELIFVAKIFEALEKNNKKEFNKIAGTFVKTLYDIDSK